MKRTLRNSLGSSNSGKEQIISNNLLKKQKLIELISTPPPQNSQEDNETFSDVLTVDTPRSDDTRTLHSDTLDSDSDTVIEEGDEHDERDDILVVRNQIVNGRGQEKIKEVGNKIINEQAKLIEEENQPKLAVNEQDKNEEKDEVATTLDNKNKDKGQILEVKKDESKLLQGIMVDTEDKSLSISLDTRRNCYSLTVKSNVRMVKISPETATCPVSLKPKKVRIVIHHQGRLINQRNHSESPYSILLRNGLNYIEIWANELKTSVDYVDHNEPGQKHLLFVTKL